MKASTVVTIAVLLASLTMAARAMAEPGVTDTEVLIGSCAALDGPANFLGQQTVLGARAYLQTVMTRAASTAESSSCCPWTTATSRPRRSSASTA